MEIERLAIPDVVIITPKKHSDDRGFFSEVYSRHAFQEAGIAAAFVQDNHAYSRDFGTVRGLHFQTPPFAQGKLVRVVRGRILDVVVDLRRGSPTYGHHVSSEISAERWNQIWIPEGFAHGLCTLEPNTEVLYKVTAPYSRTHDCGVRWNDPAIGINWPVRESNAVLSAKDAVLPLLAELKTYFTYRG